MMNKILNSCLMLIILSGCFLEQPWIFGLSMLGLIPLAERLGFLTE